MTNGYYTPQNVQAGAQQVMGTLGMMPGMMPGITMPGVQMPSFTAAPNGQQFYYGAQNVTPIVNAAWNQAASQFGYQPNVATAFNVNVGAVPLGTNPLTEDDLKLLAATKKKPFEITPEMIARAKCTHKAPAGKPNAGQIDGYSKDGGDTWHCNVCQAEFVIVDKSVEEINALVQYLMDVFDTIKLMWLNVPPQIIEGMYSIIPILGKLPEAYSQAKADWEAANNQGKVFTAGNVYTNPGFGANAYMPTPTAYPTYTPYQQMFAGQYGMPQAATPQVAPQQAQTVDYSMFTTNNPLVPTAQVAAPQVAPVAPANPYAPPVAPVAPTTTPVAPAPVAPTTTTPAPAVQTPPVGSGTYTPPVTGTPDPTNMTVTTATAQTI